LLQRKTMTPTHLLEVKYKMTEEKASEWKQTEPDGFQVVVSFLLTCFCLDKECNEWLLHDGFDYTEQYEFVDMTSIVFWRELQRLFPEEFCLLLDTDEYRVPYVLNIASMFPKAFGRLRHFGVVYDHYFSYIPTSIKKLIGRYEYSAISSWAPLLGIWHVMETVRRYPLWAKDRMCIVGKPQLKKINLRTYVSMPLNVEFHKSEIISETMKHPLFLCGFNERWKLAGVLVSCRTLFSQQEYDELCHLIIHNNNFRRITLAMEKVRIEDILFHKRILNEQQISEDLMIEILSARVAYPSTYIKSVFVAIENNTDIPVPPSD
jgi:hypothetical protein